MKPPWSTNQLKRLGDALRDEAAVPSSLPDYAEVVSWYDDLATQVHSRIESLDLAATFGVADVEVSSRAKTIGTLREKLRREWPIRLPSIQDVAGVRVTAAMSTVVQDRIVARIASEFEHTEDAVRDSRSAHHSGYRAVHLWLRLEGGRVEVQVRTEPQSMWANAYEALADLAGRGIRYDEDPMWVEGVPADLRKVRGSAATPVDFPAALRKFSTERIAMVEAMRAFAELWSEAPDWPLWTEPAIAAALSGVSVEWAAHPLLSDREAPTIDRDDPHAPRLLLAAISELERANATMLVGLRDQLDSVRREIRGGTR